MLAAFCAFIDALLQMCWRASAAAPLLISLGLISGRKGYGQSRVWGARLLGRTALALAVCGIIYFPYDYLLQILPAGGCKADIWKPLFEAPGLPWTSAFCAQFAGTLLLTAGLILLKRDAPEKYPFSFVKKPVICFLWAAAFSFASFFLINWPFAGLPQGMPADRAVLAVMRNAASHYFMAFTPAAGLSLIILAASPAKKLFPPAAVAGASRWLAFLACAGLIPSVGQAWAIIAGLGFRGNIAAYFAGGFAWHLASLVLSTMAMFLWLIQAAKKPMPGIAICAFILYLGQMIPPFIKMIAA